MENYYIVFKINEDGSKSPVSQFESLEQALQFINNQNNYSIEYKNFAGNQVIF